MISVLPIYFSLAKTLRTTFKLTSGSSRQPSTSNFTNGQNWQYAFAKPRQPSLHACSRFTYPSPGCAASTTGTFFTASYLTNTHLASNKAMTRVPNSQPTGRHFFSSGKALIKAALGITSRELAAPAALLAYIGEFLQWLETISTSLSYQDHPYPKPCSLEENHARDASRAETG
jgi:hypothetical protein